LMNDCCISSSMSRGRIRSREFGAVMSIRAGGAAGGRKVWPVNGEIYPFHRPESKRGYRAQQLTGQ
jgi:hypothetical protein